jgi:hypothetical protein
MNFMLKTKQIDCEKRPDLAALERGQVTLFDLICTGEGRALRTDAKGAKDH